MWSFFLRYFKSHTLLVEQRLQKDKLPEVVRESDVCLRYKHFQSHQAVFTTFYQLSQQLWYPFTRPKALLISQRRCQIWSLACVWSHVTGKGTSSSLTGCTSTTFLRSFFPLVWEMCWRKLSDKLASTTPTSKSCPTSWTLMIMWVSKLL